MKGPAGVIFRFSGEAEEDDGGVAETGSLDGSLPPLSTKGEGEEPLVRQVHALQGLDGDAAHARDERRYAG